MSAVITQDRWRAATTRVRQVELSSAALDAQRFLPRRFTGTGRWAWSSREGRDWVEAVGNAVHPVETRFKVPLTAAALQIGKFDVASEVRLRAFYPTLGRTIRYQSGGKRNGVRRTIQAHEAVRMVQPELMPEVLDHRELDGTEGVWLVESIVRGRPINAKELNDHAEALVERLHAVQQHVGVKGRDITRVMAPYVPMAWETFVKEASTDFGVDMASQGVDSELGEAVTKLLHKGGRVDVSLGHGDLVASNILVHEGRITLIDWEFAGPQAIVFDLSKVHMNAEDPHLAVESFSRSLGRLASRRSGYFTLTEQLVLGHVQALAWHKPRLEKARAAGRTEALRDGTAQRVKVMRQLLDLD